MEEDPGVQHVEESGSAPVPEVVVEEGKAEAAVAEASDAAEEQPKETENTKVVSTKEAEKVEIVQEEEEESLQNIEECDTGGDEVPNVCELAPVHCESPAPEGTSLADVPIVLVTPDADLPHQLIGSKEEQAVVESSDTKAPSDIVAIDDDDDDDDGDVDDDDDDDDDDDEDDDEDDDGASNEALNDDDEEDEHDDMYDEEQTDKVEKKPTQAPHPIDEFDEYEDMEDDDDDMGEQKEAVVISSSDEEDVQVAPPPAKKTQPPARKYDIDDDELDYDDDEEEDDDDYDDDDLMNAVVTSASKALSSSASSLPVKKQQRMESPDTVRQKEVEQINALSRRINYGRIAKKKSLNWLYTKKKREAYKLILPRRRPGTTAMRSDQSGGLLHLKITPPSVTSIAQKILTKPSASTPLAPRIESRVPSSSATATTPQKAVAEDYVIDLDSSPEKSEDKSTPRSQSDDQRNSETSVKKPPDTKESEEPVEEETSTMQQTDKVRDSIQKSTEQVEESKSVALLSCEQNKENLQSNEVLKKDKDEVASKPEPPADQSKETTPEAEEPMDTADNTTESTLKQSELTIASVTSLNVNIKEEQPDKAPTPPPTAEEIPASEVIAEDVQEKETPAPSATPQPASVGASKRRRSSSLAHDKARTPKPTSGSDQQDDDEDYIHPTKKLREELQSNYPAHDRILNEYIEKTSNDSIDTIQRHIEQMLSEINTLNDMIKAKEVEWNNMLHLKKVKEEICFRLTRRKQCMEIMATKVGETGHSAGLDEDYLGNESTLALGKSPPQQQNPQLSSTPIQAAINSLSGNICNFTGVSSSSSSIPTTAQLIIQNRANMKSSDLVKEKANTQRLHRNILPKPTAAGAAASPSTSAVNNQQSPSTNGPSSAPSSSNQPILTSYLTSADSVQQLVDMMNGHHNNHSGLQNGAAAGGSNNSQAAMVGRQGPFKDVRSIIADFRQQHPEAVPRRGRRVKNSNNSNLSDSNTILGNALKSDTNSRPSSNDSSSHSLSNTNQASSTNHNNVNSFKDVLAPFAKSQGATTLRSAGGQQQNPPYPEVTLHPVSTPLNASGGQDQQIGSLLHGILTKVSRPNESANTKTVANQTSNYISNFSPTLARLLTAPERISASGAGSSGNQGHHSSSGGGESSIAHHSIPGYGVNLSKVVGHNSEITITPVMNSMHQQSMLQQQLQQLQQQQQLKDVLTRAATAVSGNNVKDEHFLKLSNFTAVSAGNDDDAEDSVDRLVIDEGVDSMVGGEEHQRIAPHAIGQEFNENEVPVCQGCKKHEAQFVCAGCGNQWYCSRECQVTAWDDHSEVCTG